MVAYKCTKNCKALNELPKHLEKTLKQTDVYKEVAKQFQKNNSFFW